MARRSGSSKALAGRRQAAQQHGRGRVQARRPRPDLPQVHLRRLRGQARRARGAEQARAPTPKTRTSTAPRTSSGCRRKRAGRILKANAQQPTIGKLVDDAMVAIERDNPSLKGVLPKDYARPGSRQAAARRAHRPDQRHRVRETPSDRAKDILGRVYEYFLGAVRQRRGQEGRPVLHAAMRRPRCWSRCSRPTRAASTTRAAVRAACSCRARSSSRPTAGKHRRHLHLRPGVELHHLAAGQDEPRHPRHRRADLGRRRHASTTTCTRTSRPTTFSPIRRSTTATGAASCSRTTSAGSTACRRRATPTSPGCSTSSHHLAPTGLAGFVLANGSCRRNSPARARFARPSSRPTWWIAWWRCPASSSTPRRFPSASGSSPATRRNGRFRDRRGETLFIDARKMGTLIDRVHRELTDDDIAKIAGTYHAWRGDKDAGEYADVPGFCKAATARRNRARTAMC